MKTPQEILEDYRAALRLNYGDEVADKCIYGHSKGWFYFSMAFVTKHGIISPGGSGQPFRKSVILARTQELNRRYQEGQIMELTAR